MGDGAVGPVITAVRGRYRALAAVGGAMECLLWGARAPAGTPRRVASVGLRLSAAFVAALALAQAGCDPRFARPWIGRRTRRPDECLPSAPECRPGGCLVRSVG